MLNRLPLLLLLPSLLAGCGSLTPALPMAAQPDAGSAYVAGLFSRNKGMHFALKLRAIDGDAEYLMPMGEDSRFPAAIYRSSVAIKVQPGTYRIVEWLTYSTLSKEIVSRFPTQGDLAERFRVAAGTVSHLGNFTLESTTSQTGPGLISATRFDMCVRPVRSPVQDVQEAFMRAYPGLAQLPLTCIFCSPADDALPARRE